MRTLLILGLAWSAAFGQAATNPAVATRECYQGTSVDQGPPFHFLKAVPCDRVPSMRQVSNWTVIPPPPSSPPVTFWTLHRWQAPPLRTNRQTLLSPWFLVPHALAAVATVIDYRRSGRGEDWEDPYIPLIAVTAFDYASDRLLWRPFSVAGAAYILTRHTYGAASGNYP